MVDQVVQIDTSTFSAQASARRRNTSNIWSWMDNNTVVREGLGAGKPWTKDDGCR
jgi:hypothetical protein